jgi:hypothetical protein
MLSSVLRSPRAVEVNIQIMRAFVGLRRAARSHQELAQKIRQVEAQLRHHGQNFHTVFAIIHKLIEEPTPPRPRIGFHAAK